MIFFLNGQFLPEEEAKISVLDHGFLYGDGIYETMRTYDGKIWQLNEHLKRLKKSGRYTALRIPWTKKQMEKWIQKLVKLNGFSESRIRIMVTRGRNHFDFLSCVNPTLFILVQELHPEPEEIYAKGVDVITVKIQRTLPEAKTTSLLPLIRARQLMEKRKAYEAFFVTEQDCVTEGTITNFFMVKNGILITPVRNILLGTTRGFILKIAKKLGIKVVERDIRRAELFQADEIFITNAPRGIIPVRCVDGKKIENGKESEVTGKIAENYELRM